MMISVMSSWMVSVVGMSVMRMMSNSHVWVFSFSEEFSYLMSHVVRMFSSVMSMVAVVSMVP